MPLNIEISDLYILIRVFRRIWLLQRQKICSPRAIWMVSDGFETHCHTLDKLSCSHYPTHHKRWFIMYAYSTPSSWSPVLLKDSNVTYYTGARAALVEKAKRIGKNQRLKNNSKLRLQRSAKSSLVDFLELERNLYMQKNINEVENSQKR